MFFEYAKRHLNFLTHRIHTLPVLILMPHSRCNCRCVMCDIWKANQNSREISVEELAKHIRTFKKFKVRTIILSGGEALMHSNLWRFCELLKQMNIKISLLSTGLLLSKYVHDIIRWCDEVIVSLDGSRDIHNKIRNIPRAYEKLCEGISTIKTANTNFKVFGRCVLQKANYFDLMNIIKSAMDIGLDKISFLAIDVSTNAFNRKKEWNKNKIVEVSLNADETTHFRHIINKTVKQYASQFESKFIAESPERLQQIYQYFNALNGKSSFPENECNAPWISTVIESNGEVRPCFFHPSFGNIYDKPLEEILNSDKAIAFRRNLDVRSNPVCQKCVCTLNLRLFKKEV